MIAIPDIFGAVGRYPSRDMIVDEAVLQLQPSTETGASFGCSRGESMTRSPSLLLCAAALAVLALPSFASTIVVDGAYHEFRFGAATQDVTACMGLCTPSTNPSNADMTSSPPWTFSGEATVFIIDVGDKGDQFSAYDNLVLIGSTSVVANSIPNNNSCGFDIGCAVADAGYSRGTFVLGAGSHSLTIQITQNALGSTGGNAFFSVSGVGPTPTGTPPTSTPTSTNTPTSTPTATSPISTATRTSTATNTPTSTPTATSTPTSTATRTSTATSTPTPTPLVAQEIPTLSGRGSVFLILLLGSLAMLLLVRARR